MARLAAIANHNRCAILAVRHLTKGGRDKSIYRGVGSIDLTAACRSVLLVGADPNDNRRRAVCQIKNNLAPMANPIGYTVDDGQFFWTGTSDLSAQAMLASEQANSETLPIEEAKDFLREVLMNGPTPQKEVWKEAHQAGIAERTLQRAKSSLGVVSRKDGFSRQWVWSFPKAAIKEAT